MFVRTVISFWSSYKAAGDYGARVSVRYLPAHARTAGPEPPGSP
ncbi:hypothetical protein SCATT_26890 [Streptantibioticus cattleyicolor NRRL 8057 = DSM 46488]|uniref:Uncharacterized protein n=1 Tax=Streptantibioticus cattleyicolor (strain ATCC 35852 / DSM 46488 / JCM 4925 / NBRC 14057 / NRRL 8057) TaxID=1003195 RepID=G8X2E4_STREN|nr:hypothetical protein SCATT_26890 [Streptantibioticus cattleyicolor NRRL 8057 = DSM 46488]